MCSKAELSAVTMDSEGLSETDDGMADDVVETVLVRLRLERDFADSSDGCCCCWMFVLMYRSTFFLRGLDEVILML